IWDKSARVLPAPRTRRFARRLWLLQSARGLLRRNRNLPRRARRTRVSCPNDHFRFAWFSSPREPAAERAYQSAAQSRKVGVVFNLRRLLSHRCCVAVFSISPFDNFLYCF